VLQGAESNGKRHTNSNDTHLSGHWAADSPHLGGGRALPGRAAGSREDWAARVLAFDPEEAFHAPCRQPSCPRERACLRTTCHERTFPFLERPVRSWWGRRETLPAASLAHPTTCHERTFQFLERPFRSWWGRREALRAAWLAHPCHPRLLGMLKESDGTGVCGTNPQAPPSHSSHLALAWQRRASRRRGAARRMSRRRRRWWRWCRRRCALLSRGEPCQGCRRAEPSSTRLYRSHPGLSRQCVLINQINTDQMIVIKILYAATLGADSGTMCVCVTLGSKTLGTSGGGKASAQRRQDAVG
jgi:hypothetical protein